MTTATARPRHLAHDIYVVAVIVACLGYLVTTTVIRLDDIAPFIVNPHTVYTGIILFILCLLTQFFSFRMSETLTLSLNTAVFLASVFTVGSVMGAWIIFLSVVSYDVGRMVMARWGGAEADERPVAGLMTTFFTASNCAAIAMAGSLLFSIDTFYSLNEGWSSLSFDQADLQWYVVGLTVGLYLFFLLVQYTVVLVRYTLKGVSPRRLFTKGLAPAFVYELFFMPLSPLIVLSYYHEFDGSQPSPGIGFSILTITYVLINYIFKRLSVIGSKHERRVKELERLRVFSGEVTTNLQLESLKEMILEQTLKLFDRIDGVFLSIHQDSSWATSTLTEGELDGLHSAAIDRVVERSCSARDEVLVREALQATSAQGKRTTSHLNIFAAPMVAKEKLIGVIGLWRDSKRLIPDNQRQILKLVADQGAVALWNAELYDQATIDGLTGCFVRRYLEQRLREEADRAKRYDEDFTLVMMDLNDFKSINDVYGHVMGDKILAAIGDRLTSNLRSIDVPCRYGGDEFAILLPLVAGSEAETIIERIDTQIRAIAIPASGGDTVTISASMGYTSFKECGSMDPKGLIDAADMQQYQAKEAYRTSHRGRDVRLQTS